MVTTVSSFKVFSQRRLTQYRFEVGPLGLGSVIIGRKVTSTATFISDRSRVLAQKILVRHADLDVPVIDLQLLP